MIHAICTLHLPFIEPRFNRMTPNFPIISSSLPQNATLHNFHTVCLVLRIQDAHDIANLLQYVRAYRRCTQRPGSKEAGA